MNRGPQVERLGTYVEQCTPHELLTVSSTWYDASTALTDAAATMRDCAGTMETSLQGRTAAKATPRFRAAADTMSTRAAEVQGGRTALASSAAALAAAHAKFHDAKDFNDDIGPYTGADPNSEDAIKHNSARAAQQAQNQQMWQQQEDAAAAETQHLDGVFLDTQTAMKDIHKQPDPPEPAAPPAAPAQPASSQAPSLPPTAPQTPPRDATWPPKPPTPVDPPRPPPTSNVPPIPGDPSWPDQSGATSTTSTSASGTGPSSTTATPGSSVGGPSGAAQGPLGSTTPSLSPNGGVTAFGGGSTSSSGSAGASGAAVGLGAGAMGGMLAKSATAPLRGLPSGQMGRLGAGGPRWRLIRTRTIDCERFSRAIRGWWHARGSGRNWRPRRRRSAQRG